MYKVMLCRIKKCKYLLRLMITVACVACQLITVACLVCQLITVACVAYQLIQGLHSSDCMIAGHLPTRRRMVCRSWP